MGSGIYYPTTGLPQAKLITSTGGSFTSSALPLPSITSTNSGTINSIACAATGGCVVVGQYGSRSGGPSGFLDTLTGGAWKAVTVPIPAGGAIQPNSDPASAACFTSAACASVGTYTDAGRLQQGLMVIGSGSGWRAAAAALPKDASANPSMQMSAVTCPAASTCTAAGSYSEAGAGGSITRGLVERYCGLPPATTAERESVRVADPPPPPCPLDVKIVSVDPSIIKSGGTNTQIGPVFKEKESGPNQTTFKETCLTGCANILVHVSDGNGNVSGAYISASATSVPVEDRAAPDEGDGYLCQATPSGGVAIFHDDTNCGNPLPLDTVKSDSSGDAYLRYWAPGMRTVDGTTIDVQATKCNNACSLGREYGEDTYTIRLEQHLFLDSPKGGTTDLTPGERNALIEWHKYGYIVKNEGTVLTMLRYVSETWAPLRDKITKKIPFYDDAAKLALLAWFDAKFGVSEDGLINLNGFAHLLAEYVSNYAKNPNANKVAGWIDKLLAHSNHNYLGQVEEMLDTYAGAVAKNPAPSRSLNLRLYEASYCADAGRIGGCANLAPTSGVDDNLFAWFQAGGKFSDTFSVWQKYAAPTWMPAQCQIACEAP